MKCIGKVLLSFLLVVSVLLGSNPFYANAQTGDNAGLRTSSSAETTFKNPINLPNGQYRIKMNFFSRRDGEYFYYKNAKNIADLPLQEFARKAAIVHQYNTAADDITVERLVAFGRTPYQKLLGGPGREDEEYIDWAIRITDMEKFRDREVSKLSGGQRQRVWIAMALAQNTKILFLDEPTTYLDIRYQLDILRLVRRLNEQYGITIIMVLQDINQAIHYSDRIIGLKDGQVGMEGPPGRIITTQSIRQLYGVELSVVSVGGEKFVLTV